MIKYLQLKRNFDVAQLKAETNRLATNWWKEHYNKKHYEGGWSVLPLRSVGGDPENHYSIHSSSDTLRTYKDTPLMDGCPYIKSVLDFFECEKTTVRLMKLEAGAIIKEHTDYEMSFEEGEARFHIPVQTNEKVEFYLQDERVPMQEGECWYLNLSLKHRVSNLGTEDRVHLVIDCLVNDWLRNQFTENAKLQKEISEEELRPKYSADEKIRIVEHLRQMNTTVANELADKIELDKE